MPLPRATRYDNAEYFADERSIKSAYRSSNVAATDSERSLSVQAADTERVTGRISVRVGAMAVRTGMIEDFVHHGEVPVTELFVRKDIRRPASDIEIIFKSLAPEDDAALSVQ